MGESKLYSSPLYEAALRKAEADVSAMFCNQITDAGSIYFGGVRSADTWDVNFHDTAALYVWLTELYLLKDSACYGRKGLYDRIRMAYQYCMKWKHEDGTKDYIDCDFFTGAGSEVQNMAKTIHIIDKYGTGAQKEMLRKQMTGLMQALAEGLVTGGFHTPNHRWIFSGALAAANSIAPSHERKTGDSGLVADGPLPALAAYAYMEYALYCYTKDESHAKKSIRALTDMGKLSDAFLESNKTTEREAGKSYTVRQAVLTSGRPPEVPMETMFCPTYYLLAYHGLEEKGLFTGEDKEYCEKAVFRSIQPLFAYTDWSPQNRGMIKGCNLMLAGTCFPGAPGAPECLKLGEVLCSESLGKWSIEDAQVYIPIWLNQIIVYQNICGSEDYYKKPVVKFYFDYMLELTPPQRMIPKFGDGRYLNSAEAYICCLERGASVYRDGRMRYAAAKITEYMLSHLKPYCTSLNNVCFLASALLWSDETVTPKPFAVESGEAPEDIIGKKYRFCNGEGRDCQYLLFNYRDEGDYAGRTRNYMRATLVVEHEKMHHGHADENSIVLLQAGDSILLRDGGYRDMDGQESILPGSYRSDFYHNRLVVRKGLLPEGKDFIEFCSREPCYSPVRTEKIYFERFKTCEAGRTRLVDLIHGTESDRVVLYDKENRYYLILDTVTALENGDYTFGPLYYGQGNEDRQQKNPQELSSGKRIVSGVFRTSRKGADSAYDHAFAAGKTDGGNAGGIYIGSDTDRQRHRNTRVCKSRRASLCIQRQA